MKICGLNKSSTFVNKDLKINPCSANSKISFTSKSLEIPAKVYHLTTYDNWKNTIENVGLQLKEDFLCKDIKAVFTFDSIKSLMHWKSNKSNFAWDLFERVSNKMKMPNDKFVLLEIEVDSVLARNLWVRNVKAAQNKVSLEGVPITNRKLTKKLGKAVEYFFQDVNIPRKNIKYLGEGSIEELFSIIDKSKNEDEVIARFLGGLMNILA